MHLGSSRFAPVRWEGRRGSVRSWHDCTYPSRTAVPKPDLKSYMSFGDHLEELRRRLIFALIGVAVIFVIAAIFGGELLSFITHPVTAALHEAGQAANLQATSPLESFSAFLKIAAVAALLVGMPWILYQAWLFISPGLYEREQRFIYILIPMSLVMTMLGLLLLYFVVLPLCLYFFIDFGAGLVTSHAATAPLPPGITLPQVPVLAADPTEAPAGSYWFNATLGQIRIMEKPGHVMAVPLGSGSMIAQQYRVGEYIDLVLMMGLAFGIAFQVPLVLMLLSWTGIVRPEHLTPYRKKIIFGCVVGAALLPTQDPWSLLVLSLMLIGLFEFGIVLMRFMPLRRLVGLDAKPAHAAAALTDGDAEA